MGDACASGWKRMGLRGGSKTKWLRAVDCRMDEGCASRLGGKLQAGRKVRCC